MLQTHLNVEIQPGFIPGEETLQIQVSYKMLDPLLPCENSLCVSVRGNKYQWIHLHLHLHLI